jgi:hypothetical protein
MKKIVIIMLAVMTSVASAIEFKTLPLVYPQGGLFIFQGDLSHLVKE